MPKGKITIITEVEYNIDMQLYRSAGAKTLDEAVALDIKSAGEQPELWLDMKGAKIVVKGELINEINQNV